MRPPAGITRTVGSGAEGIVYDPVTKVVAVAVRFPNRLLLLDPATLRIERTVPLPGSARHLQLAAPGGPVLVPAESANELVTVAVPGGAERSTSVGRQPHDAAGSGADVVVGNEFGHSISVLQAGVVIRTITGLRQPGGVIGDGTTAAVVDVGAFTVSTYDLTTLRRIAVAPAGEGPTHGVLVPGQRLAIADTRGDAILLDSVSPLQRLATLALPGTPYGVAMDSVTDTLWVTLTGSNQVVGVDLGGATPRVIARYPTVRQPDSVAVQPGSHRLWITGTSAGEVELITR